MVKLARNSRRAMSSTLASNDDNSILLLNHLTSIHSRPVSDSLTHLCYHTRIRIRSVMPRTMRRSLQPVAHIDYNRINISFISCKVLEHAGFKTNRNNNQQTETQHNKRK